MGNILSILILTFSCFLYDRNHVAVFSIRVFFHGHRRFTGLQGKGRTSTLFLSTNSTLSRIFRFLFILSIWDVYLVYLITLIFTTFENLHLIDYKLNVGLSFNWWFNGRHYCSNLSRATGRFELASTMVLVLLW